MLKPRLSYIIDYQAMGRRLNKSRKRFHLSPKQIATMLDMPLVQYELIEQGEQMITVSLLMKLCCLLGLSPSYLLCGEVNHNSSWEFRQKKDLIDLINIIERQQSHALILRSVQTLNVSWDEDH